MRQAFNKMLRFISAPVWKTNLGAPLGLLADVLASDKGKGFDLNILDNYIRAATLTISHASGTAAMSPRGADWGVVDPDLRVKGVSGLRIVDGSIFVSTTIVPVGIMIDFALALHSHCKHAGADIRNCREGGRCHQELKLINSLLFLLPTKT